MSNLQFGFGRADITPTIPVPLTGFGNDVHRYWDNVLDPIYATCLAFTDEDGTTALIYTADILYANGWMRDAISKAVGIPADNINVSATHTHSAPGVWLERDYAGNREYLRGEMTDGLVKAAQLALADRKPLTGMYITAREVEGLNFVRQYLMEDGSYAGPNFGSFKKKIAAHETEADHEMQLVKLTREGEKDVLLCNFGVHQTATGGMYKYNISADIAGVVRAKVEHQLDCRLAYFTGACGNVDPGSLIRAENRVTTPKAIPGKDHVGVGSALADDLLEIADTFRPVQTGKVRVERQILDMEVDHSLDHMEDIARAIRTEWKQTGDRVKCNAMCREVGLNSVYHAESVIDKLELGKTLDIDLNVVSVGDVAFAMVPYEMFDTNGMQVKAGSPFEMTMIATCSNTVRSYIPSAIGFEHGGYSVDRCRYAAGSGERLADEFVAMLDRVKKQG